MESRHSRAKSEAVRRSVSCSLVGALIGLSTPTAAKPRMASETITISRRPWFAICAGLCPNYDVTVSKNGEVAARIRSAGERDAVTRYRVSRSDVARFRGILQPLKPRAFHLTRPSCDHAVTAEERPLLLRVSEIEIRWGNAGSRQRLMACDNERDQQIRQTIERALEAVHLSVAAQRL